MAAPVFLAGEIVTAAKLALLGGHGGIGSGTTDASGFLTFNHGAPFTPDHIVATARSPISGGGTWSSGAVDSITATTARIRINTGVATAITFHYHCYP